MIVTFPRCRTKKLHEGDLIALTRDDKFIGYGEVITVLESGVLVKADTRASKTFNEIYGEAIPFELELD